MDTNDYEIFRKVSYVPFVNKNRTFQLSDYPYLDIVFNDHCNARCKFCIAHLVSKRVKADVENIKRKARFAIENMGVREVLLLGGEATINDDIFEVITYLKQFDLRKICITTNGHRMAMHPQYAIDLFGSGITHLNLSLMNLDPEEQMRISGSKTYVGLPALRMFKELSEDFGVKLRINNNVFIGNNDTVEKALVFHKSVAPFCDSVKFSPLLKTDAFSTVNEVTQFNRDHILTDDAYDDLWHGIERAMGDYSIVRNLRTFGFVEYSMIVSPTPIILNYNQHGQLRKMVVEEHKINNLKLLPTGQLSLSWNREETDFVIDVP